MLSKMLDTYYQVFYGCLLNRSYMTKLVFLLLFHKYILIVPYFHFQVMNQFLHKMGMPTLWAMTDVFGLDDMLLDMLPQPVVALMLLFPINDKVKLISITYLLKSFETT